MDGAERCLNKMSIYFQIMLTSFMSAVIPTSAGAVPFYDDLHCKKFAYSRERYYPPTLGGIKILIAVSMKRIRAFYCGSEHDHAFIWYVHLAFTRSNPTSVRSGVLNGTKNKTIIYLLFIDWVWISIVWNNSIFIWGCVTLSRFWLSGHFEF